MRRDAERNRELILEAAREVYAEQGVEAPLDVIARRAGVGNATVYRRFPDRATLIDAVFGEALTATLHLGEEARTAHDPWKGLTGYLTRIFEGLAADRGANDLMTTKVQGIPSLDTLHAHHHRTIELLLTRAQRQGSVRADVTTEDLLLALAALGRTVPAASAVVRDSWRRHLALLLDGLRAAAAVEPLPDPSLDAAQLTEVLHGMTPLAGGAR
ncbi:helix-turn-helix domain-containing protein [Streptomyces sp. 549]|uniref:TetR/AcrR family transcriptional regulator n=1 Tax=Streptomyces sp. 549 TaxID=3049076 RepID=UPI0024C39D63|nr:helix-turn-helix domain-containing protein [Streptomyces sp. 549]MDK1475325.1 helix-turn-helix domain-containing protein [Streptomyces sp. 549]